MCNSCCELSKALREVEVEVVEALRWPAADRLSPSLGLAVCAASGDECTTFATPEPLTLAAEAPNHKVKAFKCKVQCKVAAEIADRQSSLILVLNCTCKYRSKAA